VSPPPPADPGAGPPQDPRPLRTEPRSVMIHWCIDAAVVFLATIVIALIVGIPWEVVLVLSLALGACAAPVTHRADERAMAARREG